jgi:hypothetical protein
MEFTSRNEESIRILREDLRRRLRQFLNSRSADVLVVQYPPGSGKTYGVVEELIQQEVVFGFFGAVHETLEENISRVYSMNHLYGKQQLCQNPLKEKLTDMGLLSCSYACQLCRSDSKQGCEWRAHVHEFHQQPGTFVAVHHHFNLLQDFMEKNSFDLAVIDENFLDAMVVELKLEQEDLQYTKLLIQEHMPPSKEKDYTIDVIHRMIMRFFGQKLIIPKPMDLELKVFAKDYQNKLVSLLDRKQWIHRDIVSKLLEFIVLSQHNKARVHFVRKTKGRSYIEMKLYDFSKLDINMPLIILDATTPVDVYKKILKDRVVESIKPEVEVESHVYQLNTFRFSMQELSDKRLRRRAFELIRGICQKHNDEQVFIAIRKKYKNLLWEHLKGIPNANIAHYGGLRGANAFKEANVAVLVGAPIPNPDIVEQKSQLLGVPKNEIEEMDCNQEMLQTIHRIRPLLKPTSWVYILTKDETGYLCNDHHDLPITQLEMMVNT